MDSICFYQPPQNITAFSNKATRFRDPPAFMPTGSGRQHTKWDDALECVEVVEVVDLTSFNEKGPILERQPTRNNFDRAQGNSTLKALKVDRVKHGAEDDRHNHRNTDDVDDDSDDDDLPPLSDLLREWGRNTVMERSALSMKRGIPAEWLLDGSVVDSGLAMADAGAEIGTLKPGDSREEPMELDDDDGSHATAPNPDYERLGASPLGGPLGMRPSSCDLSGKITVGGQHVGATSAEEVHGNANREGANEASVGMFEQPQPAAPQTPTRPCNVREAARKAFDYDTLDRVPPASAGNIHDIFAEYDRTARSNRTREDSKGRQRRPSSSCLSQARSGRSIASVDATGTMGTGAARGHHRQYGHQVNPPRSSPLLEVALESIHSGYLIDSTAQSATELYSEDLNPEHGHCEELDGELDLGREPFTSSRGSSKIRRKQSSFRTGSQDIAHGIATRRYLNNDTDVVRPPPEEERNPFALFSIDATQRDVGPLGQRSLRPRKRSMKSERSITYLGDIATPALTPSSQANRSRANHSNQTGNTPPTLDGKDICVGDYVFVRCEGDREAAVREIAKVERIYPNGRLGMLWAYHPVHPHVPREIDFGPYEILLSDHKDTVRVECLMGYVEVEKNCKDCERAPHWCWNKRYRAKQRKVVSSSRTTKKRRVEV